MFVYRQIVYNETGTENGLSFACDLDGAARLASNAIQPPEGRNGEPNECLKTDVTTLKPEQLGNRKP